MSPDSQVLARVRSSKTFGIAYLLAAVIFAITAAFAMQAGAAEQPIAFITVAALVVLVHLFLALRNFTTIVTVTKSELRLKTIFVRQVVQLQGLRIDPYDDNPSLMYVSRKFLKLRDMAGNRLTLFDEDFGYEDWKLLMSYIAPALVYDRAEIMSPPLSLYFNYEPAPASGPRPKTSIWQILRGTFLYVLLPAAVIVAAMFVWAYITHQPGIRP